MRSLIISLILFAVVCGAIVANGIYVTRISERIASLAAELPEQSHESAVRSVDELTDYWEKHRTFLGLGLGSSGIEHLNELIISLRYAVSDRNALETARLCALIREQCADISLHERLSIHGIL